MKNDKRRAARSDFPPLNNKDLTIRMSKIAKDKQDIAPKGFSKQITLACKGVAVCLLLWHHYFWQGGSFYSTVFVGGIDVVEFTGQLGKVCVAIFFLLSSYGLTLSYAKWKEEKKRFGICF
ncbi:MAG: hypothetical protein LBL82_00020 [Oscillospiraceae bacterium]|jgi:hypothetical protein|nr:hypothetical protein [Oscillospiraceae bacterium]